MGKILNTSLIFSVLLLATFSDNAIADASGGAVPDNSPSTDSGGASFINPGIPSGKSEIVSQRSASIVSNAPQVVQRMVDAANSISHKPYLWGGGHQSWKSRGYDCSGAVSFVLRAGKLLKSPLASGALAKWGRRGKGRWITVYANRSHAFVVIDGMRFDTSGRGEDGPRWRNERRSYRGFIARHPVGL